MPNYASEINAKKVISVHGVLKREVKKCDRAKQKRKV